MSKHDFCRSLLKRVMIEVRGAGVPSGIIKKSSGYNG